MEIKYLSIKNFKSIRHMEISDIQNALILVGKNNTKEIDFIAIHKDEKIYVQVCVQIPENSNREVGNLMEIRDHYPKYVVTLNEMDVGIENGIRIVHLRDFLLAKQW